MRLGQPDAPLPDDLMVGETMHDYRTRKLQDRPALVIDYTNYRGERGMRKVKPRDVFFGTNKYHNDEQWFIIAYDCTTGADVSLAMRDIHSMHSEDVISQWS